MKLKILHFSLLFAATTAKDVYAEGATTDSPGAEAVVPAAKLGVNEAANDEYFEDAATDSSGADQAIDPAAKLGVNEAANHRHMSHHLPYPEEIKNNHVDGCQRGFWGFLDPKCGVCEGDCDHDSDCAFGLRCFQRDGSGYDVPGCIAQQAREVKGMGKNNWDYCIYDFW